MKNDRYINNLFEDIPKEILGEIRINIQLYQTEENYDKYRYNADFLIKAIEYTHPEAGKLLKHSLERVIEYTKRNNKGERE